MHPQLRAIIDELGTVEQRLRLLHGLLPGDVWCQAPGPGRWSASECVAHLNLASQATLPLIREALREAATRAQRSTSRYRPNVVGWLIWKLIAPSARLRTQTIPMWAPAGGESAAAVLADFSRLQAEIIACVREADRLPIDLVTLRSPVHARVTFNLYAALMVIARHQQRHVRQAERAVLAGGTELSAVAS